MQEEFLSLMFAINAEQKNYQDIDLIFLLILITQPMNQSNQRTIKMPLFNINWTEDHSLLIEANSLKDAIEIAQDSDEDTYIEAHFDTNDCFECTKEGLPITFPFDKNFPSESDLQ